MTTVPVEQAREAYLWKPAAKAFSIVLDYDVVDRLSVEVMRGLGATRRRGTEVGGLLLGQIERRPETQVLVQDFQAVPCEYAHGPSYRLSPGDAIQFGDAVREHFGSPRRERQVVGFFRSHTREGLELDEEDLQLYQQYFRDPAHVVLLVKPYATRAGDAGFFFQEDGKLSSRETALQFPFRRSELLLAAKEEEVKPSRRSEVYAVPSAEPIAAPSSALAPPPVPLQVDLPVAATSPPPVPLQVDLPVAATSPPPVPLRVDLPVAATSPPPVRLAAQTKVKTEAPAVTPAPKQMALQEPPETDPLPERTPPPKAAATVAPAKTPVSSAPEPQAASAAGRVHRAEPPAFTLLQAESSGVSWRLLLAFFTFSILLVAVGAVGGFQHAGGSLRSLLTRTDPVSPYGLGLEVKETGDHLQVRWNPDSPALTAASRGSLTISEGPNSRLVELDGTQLRNGTVLYRHLAPELFFRLEVGVGDRRSLTETAVYRAR